MVTTPISPSADSEHAVSASLPWQILEYWHLLSLDAPTVAVAWSWAFAHAAGEAMPWLNALALGLATWLLYVADRLLDGLATTKGLRERHHFHARHRKAFLAAAFPAACLVGWLAITQLDHAQLLNDLKLSTAAFAYLLCVHLPLRLTANLFPKELAVAIIFATACVIPAWSQAPAPHAWLLIAGLLFAMLCWLNCIAIETWEATAVTRLHAATRRIGSHLRGTCFGLSVCACGVALAAAVAGRKGFAVLALCVAASAMLLRVLDEKYMTPLQLRAAADAVLLTPLAALLLQLSRLR